MSPLNIKSNLIYSIICNTGSFEYIGQTLQYLNINIMHLMIIYNTQYINYLINIKVILLFYIMRVHYVDAFCLNLVIYTCIYLQ